MKLEVVIVLESSDTALDVGQVLDKISALDYDVKIKFKGEMSV